MRWSKSTQVHHCSGFLHMTHSYTHTLLSSNKQYWKRHISTRTNIFSKKNLSRLTDIARLHCSSRLFVHLVWLVVGILLQRVFSLMQGYNLDWTLILETNVYHKEFEYFSHSEGFCACWVAGGQFCSYTHSWDGHYKMEYEEGGIYTNMDYVLTFCLLSFKS